MWPYNCERHIPDVLKATADMGEIKYRNVHAVADFILNHIEDYPTFRDLKPTNTKADLPRNFRHETKIRYNVSQAMSLLGWPRYGSIGCRRAVYVDPRVKDELTDSIISEVLSNS